MVNVREVDEHFTILTSESLDNEEMEPDWDLGLYSDSNEEVVVDYGLFKTECMKDELKLSSDQGLDSIGDKKHKDDGENHEIKIEYTAQEEEMNTSGEIISSIILEVLSKNCQSSEITTENVITESTKQTKTEDSRKTKRGTIMPNYAETSSEDGELELMKRLGMRRVSA